MTIDACAVKLKHVWHDEDSGSRGRKTRPRQTELDEIHQTAVYVCNCIAQEILSQKTEWGLKIGGSLDTFIHSFIFLY